MARGLRILGIVVGAVLALTTASRIQVWQSEQSLWLEAVQRSPQKPRAWINLGREYALAGDRGRAAQAFRQAVVLADAPGRGHDEQAFGVGFGFANLALLEADRGGRDYREILAPAVARYPRMAVLYQVTVWLDARFSSF